MLLTNRPTGTHFQTDLLTDKRIYGQNLIFTFVLHDINSSLNMNIHSVNITTDGGIKVGLKTRTRHIRIGLHFRWR